jgi:hypothetical protein
MTQNLPNPPVSRKAETPADRWLHHMTHDAGATIWTPAVPPRPAPTYTARAFNATLDNMTTGVALRTTTGAVHFRAHDTHLWTQLTDDDAPRLVLAGRLDLIAEAKAADALHGSLYQLIDHRNSEHAKVAA